jgi:cytochrome c-type biogenesis protein CcmE
MQFKVTDLKSDLRVRFSGVLPSLFREGQGVVAEGRLTAGGLFDADTILAKHDSKYMPPEVEKALKKRGLWRGATVGKAHKPVAALAVQASSTR